MARTVEQIIQEQVGALFVQYASILAALEAAQERLKELEEDSPEKE